MKKSQRIGRIAGLAATEQRIAAQSLAAAQRELTVQQGQLASLRHYHSDYLQRLSDGNALTGYEAQKLRVFAQRIEQVVASLERRVSASERRVERERLRMLGHRRRANALEEVAERARSAETRLEEERLQNEIDDLRRELSLP